MSDIKLGIIGAGNIAAKHLEVIRDIESLTVTGITSRTLRKADTLAKEFKIPEVYQSSEELIEQGKPDALLILVSADQIFAVAQNVMPFKLPVFIEKPPGLHPAQTEYLAEMSDKFNIPNMVGYNRRYYSIFHKGLDIVRSRGKLLGVAIEGHERFWNVADRVNDSIRLNWIFGNSTHTIDLLRFFGGEIKTISTVRKIYREKKGDQFCSAMEFDSGALGNYLAHWYSPGGWVARLFGEGVTVEFKPLEKGVYTDTDFNTHEIIPDDIDIKYKPGFFKQMEEFKRLIETNELNWPGQNLKQIHATMLLAENISMPG